jgi:hypothetical protein
MARRVDDLALGASRSAPMAAIFSPAMPTSPTKVPAGVTTLPPLMMRSSVIGVVLRVGGTDGTVERWNDGTMERWNVKRSTYNV